MRIVFLARSLDRGGSERQLVLLASALRARGHEVAVVVMYPGGALEPDLRQAGVPLVVLDKRGRWDLLHPARRLVSELRRLRPDVLHGYLATANLAALLVKPLIPGTRIVWGVRAGHMDLSRYDWASSLNYLLERLCAHFADLIIVNSRVGRTYHIARGFPAGKMIVITNAVDTTLFCPDPHARQRVRSEWGVAADEHLIGLVARLDPMKDHATFIRAAILAARQRADLRFVCVGGGSVQYQRTLQGLLDDGPLAQRFIWAGERPDMWAVYPALDIACLSSYGEGFPNALCEAMACGVPCVATDVGDARRIVGGSGVLVPPRDPRGLAAGWETMLARLAKDGDSVRRQARARAVAHLSVDTLAENTLRALEGMREDDRTAAADRAATRASHQPHPD